MGIRFKGSPKLLCNIFFVSTLNSLDGVLCSIIVSEWLKMRKFYGIHYYQDTISGVEVSNNVININKLWEVSTSFVILYYFWFQHYFFQSWKIEFSKDLGAVGCSPPPQSPRFLWTWVFIGSLHLAVCTPILKVSCQQIWYGLYSCLSLFQNLFWLDKVSWSFLKMDAFVIYWIFSFEDCLPFGLVYGEVYKYLCGRCNSTFYGETDRHLKVRSGEHIGISPLTFKETKPSKESAVWNHLLNCNNIQSFEEFTILPNRNNKFVLAIKENVLIKRDRLKTLVLLDCFFLTKVSFLIVSLHSNYDN